MAKTSDGFVSLTSLRQPAAHDPAAALAAIRRIYFKTTKQTIENDLAHAIELLKTLDTEEQREKAAVFMDGISQMRSEWARKEASGKSGRSGRSGKVSAKGPRGRGKRERT